MVKKTQRRMKKIKLWNYRFYGLILIGLVLLLIGLANCLTIYGMIIWLLGFFTSLAGTIFQIIIAPNFKK